MNRSTVRGALKRIGRAASDLKPAKRSETETRLRAELETAPARGETLLELGRELLKLQRHAEAVDVLFEAAEAGSDLAAVARILSGRASLYDILKTEPRLRQLRSLAEADAGSVNAQIATGRLLLDLGDVDAGRAVIRRGYRLRYPDLVPSIAEDPSDSTSSLGPGLFLLGPHKSGTSSLYALLTQHPRIIREPRKELWFLGNERGRGLDCYEAYFPPIDPDAGVLTGDFSPTTLRAPNAAAVVKERFPTAKAIVLHREPVSRAYSHFQMHSRFGSEHRDFSDAIDREIARIGPIPPLDPGSLPNEDATYLLGSCILPYLKTWIDALGAEQVLVVESRYLAEHRDLALQDVFEFLELPAVTIPETNDRMVGEYSPIAPEDRARLTDWFAPHEAALAELLESHPRSSPPRSQPITP